jgi:hypothetical protein
MLCAPGVVLIDPKFVAQWRRDDPRMLVLRRRTARLDRDTH